MRLRKLTCLLAGVFAAVLAARAAAPDSLALPPSVPTPDSLPPLRPPNLPPTAPPLRPTAQLDADFFLPKNLAPTLANTPPVETRTTAQLESLLAAYVGTWRGESTWYSTAGGPILHYPTTLVYHFDEQDGRRTLACSITYTINGEPSLSLAHFWIERGHIVSEVSQPGRRQHFVGHTDGSNLIWTATDSTQAALDYGEIETLRLTADGGRLSTTGFEIQRGMRGAIFIYETSELKLVQ